MPSTHSHLLLAAGGLGTLLVIVVFVALSSVNRWLQKQRDAEMGDWDTRRPPVPPATPRRPTEAESWEEELRRLLRGPAGPPLPHRPRPSQPAPGPATEEGPSFEMPSPTESRTALEQAERLPETVSARLEEVASHLGEMAESRKAMAEAYQLEAQTQTEVRAGIAGSLGRARAPHDRPHPAAAALLRQLREPAGARQAVLASMVLAPPKGLEP